MNIETNRLNTFANWPASAPVDPIRIAKAGFFYTGEGTEVQCFSCGGKISQWNYGDQVMWRHRNMEPNCVFVVNPQLSGNVPLVLGGDGRECPTNLANNNSSVQQQPDSTADGDYGHTDEDEMYKSDALRLLSFINWNDPSVSREALVSAGFYHAGEGRLRCAWCGGELAPFRNFGTLGHPLDVHRMYFPQCRHAAQLESAQRSVTVNIDAVSSPSPPAYSPTQSPENMNGRPQSSGAAHNELLLAAGTTWRALGVVGGGARHPAHAALASRLATFEGWPADRTQTPRGLAEAGFFYTGTDDQDIVVYKQRRAELQKRHTRFQNIQAGHYPPSGFLVRCFYCDGGLGKWEAGDAPWAEHARWFPTCGYVLLVKGHQFVDASAHPNNAPTENNRQTTRRQTSTINFPVDENQVNDIMEGEIAMAALGAGLDAARVRRAIVKRLRTTGLPFNTSEALIDAVLDSQLSEEAWSIETRSRSQRLARDILAETLRELAPSNIIPSSQEDSSDGRVSTSTSPSGSPLPPEQSMPSPQRRALQIPIASRNNVISPQPIRTSQNQLGQRTTNQNPSPINFEEPDSSTRDSRTESENVLEGSVVKKKLTLEEENRQLKEARLCKVCMDSEVGVVFLPCGHLAACGGCGAALPACPLCRAPVKALVRAYLA